MSPNRKRDGVSCSTEICSSRFSSKKLHVSIYDVTISKLHVLIINNRIDENFVIKVADFGLSEDIYCKDYFRQVLSGNPQEEGVIKLPIKWMALESLSDGIFTEKADVVSHI